MNENIVEIQTQKNTMVIHHFFLCKQTKYGKCVHQSMCSPSFGLHTIPSRIFQALYFLNANLYCRCVCSGVFFFFQCWPPFYKLRHQGIVVVHDLKSRDIRTSKLNFQQVSISKSLDIKHICVIPVEVNLSCASLHIVSLNVQHTQER